jgi:hypothetical protein
MASEKDIPGMVQIEDVKGASLKEAMASQRDISSTDSNETTKSQDHDSPPDGGLCAWLQVFAGWILVLNSR